VQVSLITKIVPSPDWFIGLDSLDLCREGEFIDQISLEVSVFFFSYLSNYHVYLGIQNVRCINTFCGTVEC
jgi:hypothetical protein